LLKKVDNVCEDRKLFFVSSMCVEPISSMCVEPIQDVLKTYTHTFFVNRFFRTRYKKKINSRYNAQKKFIITHKKISRIIEMIIAFL